MLGTIYHVISVQNASQICQNYIKGIASTIKCVLRWRWGLYIHATLKTVMGSQEYRDIYGPCQSIKQKPGVRS